MFFYCVAQVCKNGHLINDQANVHILVNKDFCPKCGAETITSCPACRATIQGAYKTDTTVIPRSNSSLDSFCYNCGKPYPWTQAALLAAAGLIYEEECIPDDLKDRTVDSLKDIIVETPQTTLAATRIKKCLLSAGNFTAEGIRQFVIDFGCELAKKTLGL